MKKIMVYILCSTAITLIVLAALAKMFGATFIFISSVFESLFANIVIHLGLLFTRKFESEYAVLEYTVDIGYTTLVVLVFGLIFDWYSSTPVGVLVLISIAVYLAGVLLSAIQTRQEIYEINELIKTRNTQLGSKETHR